MAAPSTSPDKHAFFTHMLGEHAIVRVHIAGLSNGVRLPDRFKVLSVMLEYGLNLVQPIPDLLPDVSGLYATLSFSGNRFHTFIPWEAVFAIVDAASGRGVVWPSEIPPELLEKKVEAAPPAKRPSHLRLVQ